jgi:glutathione synthase/RimK-type ligase-like ATP-grasp enzyme
VLFTESPELPAGCRSFIDSEAVRTAGDKRLLAEVFARAGVPTPETRLVGSLDEARRFAAERADREWCLKYPIGCGAAGHRLLAETARLPADWPLPLIVQEFIRMPRPEVYRLYAAGGQVFGLVARRFPPQATPSPWDAHAPGTSRPEPRRPRPFPRRRRRCRRSVC